MEATYVFINRWLDKQNVEYVYKGLLAIEKREILLFPATWMDLEGIMLSEISHTEKNKYCMIPTYM